MTAPDLAVYLEHVAPSEMSWSQIRNLAAIRRAYDRPISVFGFEAIRHVLATAEAKPKWSR